MILSVLYELSREFGLIVSVFSFLFAILIWIIPTDKAITKKKKGFIAGVCVLTLILLGVNYFKMQEYVKVPCVEGLEYSIAENQLKNVGLTPKAITTQILKRTDYVEKQNVKQDEIVKKGDIIVLSIREEGFFNNSLELPTNSQKQEETSSKNETPTIEQNSKVEETLGLSIIVDEYEFFYDGYHYEQLDEENEGYYWSIDFDKGIAGKFHYSRPLTDEELRNWGHGGELYDSSGNKVGEENNYPHFWSDPTGHFAMQFPKDLEPGKYTYVFYNVIGLEYVETKIEFTI